MCFCWLDPCIPLPPVQYGTVDTCPFFFLNPQCLQGLLVYHSFSSYILFSDHKDWLGFRCLEFSSGSIFVDYILLRFPDCSETCYIFLIPHAFYLKSQLRKNSTGKPSPRTYGNFHLILKIKAHMLFCISLN